MNWTGAARERIALLKQYEPIQPYLLYEMGKAAGSEVFLDIGANIGAYSILMASLPLIQEVHAFEPTPSTNKELVDNVGQNSHASKITTHPVALSDRTGSVKFGIVSDLSGANSIVDTTIHDDLKFARRVEVTTSPLDIVLKFDRRKLLMKIDVEGHELNVLNGAKQTLASNECLIQIEDYNSRDATLTNFFLSIGYHCLFNVGPDQYFSNSPVSSETIVHAFSAASTMMVSENFDPKDDAKSSAIRLGLPLGIGLEFSGSLAKRLRAVRNSFR
jgi:FkbM family methyltransferase